MNTLEKIDKVQRLLSVAGCNYAGNDSRDVYTFACGLAVAGELIESSSVDSAEWSAARTAHQAHHDLGHQPHGDEWAMEIIEQGTTGALNGHYRVATYAGCCP